MLRKIRGIFKLLGNINNRENNFHTKYLFNFGHVKEKLVDMIEIMIMIMKIPKNTPYFEIIPSKKRRGYCPPQPPLL